jgi:acyl-CoA thioesterase FadM
MTRNLQVDYRRPCPLHTDLTLTGHHVRREGRKLFHRAELRNARGYLLAEATGLFIAIDPALLRR